LKEAVDAFKGIKKVHDERRNQRVNYEKHHEKRLERAKSRDSRSHSQSKRNSGMGADAVVPVAPLVPTGYDPHLDPKFDIKGEPGSHRDEWGYQDRPGMNGIHEPDFAGEGDREYGGNANGRRGGQRRSRRGSASGNPYADFQDPAFVPNPYDQSELPPPPPVQYDPRGRRYRDD